MKTRKLLLLVISFALTAALALTAYADVVYDGTDDLKTSLEGTCDYPANEGEVGTKGSGRLAAAGEPGYAWDDENGLFIFNRVNRWDSVDVTLGGLADGSYTLEVLGTTSDGGGITIEEADSPWMMLADADSGTTVTYDFEVRGGMSDGQNRFRLNNESMGDFYIKTILIHGAEGAAAAADGGTLLYRYTFDDGPKNEEFFSPAEAIEFTWVSDFGMTDEYSLKATHIDGMTYTSSSNAIVLELPEALPAGGVYRVTASFYVPAEGNEGKDTLTGPGFLINGDYAGAQGVSKFPADFGDMPVGEWKTIDVTMPAAPENITRLDFRFVINDEPNHADVWYIDDIEIYQIGAPAAAEPVREWDLSIPSLAEAFADYFPFGAAAAYFTDPEMEAAFLHHFNSVTAENDMKPAYLSREKGEYSFDTADRLVDWANENGVRVHGHTLVWHSQSNRWVNIGDDGNPLPRAEARANMEEYINNVAGHFAGRVVSWDVVNEAFSNNGGTPSQGWKAALRKDSPWYEAYENGADTDAGESGADYIYDAFVFARLADPGATLYYNDFNEEIASKRENMAEMAEELNELWKSDPRNTDPDRLLIEVIGMQSHFFSGGLNPADVEATIVRFIETGAKVAVTEIDIPYGTYNTYTQRRDPLTAEESMEQARLYGELFDIYVKYAEHIDKVTIWGMIDNRSWRSAGYPLLFDRNYQAKDAYWAVIEASGYDGTASAEAEPPAEEAEPVNEEESEPAAEEEAPAAEPEPVQTTTAESDDDGGINFVWIIVGVVIGAIAGFVIYKARNPKK